MEESLQNISEILLKMSQKNGGIVINDTWGGPSFFTSIVTSIIGAIIGGIITIILFKRQGQIQTREQMRLDCINILLKDLINLKNNIYEIYISIQNLYSEHCMNTHDLVYIQVLRAEMNNPLKLEKIMKYVDENIIILDKYYKDIAKINLYKQQIYNMMNKLECSFLSYNITSYNYLHNLDDLAFNLDNNLSFTVNLNEDLSEEMIERIINEIYPIMKDNIESEMDLYNLILELRSIVIYKEEFYEGKYQHYAILNDIIFEDYQEILNLLEELIYKIYCQEYRGIFRASEIRNRKPIKLENKRRDWIALTKLHNYLKPEEQIASKFTDDMFDENYWTDYLLEDYMNVG